MTIFFSFNVYKKKTSKSVQKNKLHKDEYHINIFYKEKKMTKNNIIIDLYTLYS